MALKEIRKRAPGGTAVPAAQTHKASDPSSPTASLDAEWKADVDECKPEKLSVTGDS